MSIFSLLSVLVIRICSINSKLYISYLRKKGVSIGEGTRFFGGNISIDHVRPCMVEIGRNCIITGGVSLLTHDYSWAVLKEKYGEALGAVEKVVLEDNVFVGIRSIILKGVRIGRNTIIGAGSVVTHDIPPDSVAAGNPCEVIMSIDEYYQKRKALQVREVKAYALELYRKTGKVPKKEDFSIEFTLFLKGDDDWGKLPVKEELGSALGKFVKSKPLYNSIEEFLIDAGIPKEKIEKEKVAHKK